MYMGVYVLQMGTVDMLAYDYKGLSGCVAPVNRLYLFSVGDSSCVLWVGRSAVIDMHRRDARIHRMSMCCVGTFANLND